MIYSYHHNLVIIIFDFKGNSNSLATVDVGSGYTGRTNFHPALVSSLICLNTYGPIILSLASLHARKPELILSESTSILAILRTLELVFFLSVVTSQRYHLFVWTVFSPKILYEFTFHVVITLVMTLLNAVRHIC